MIWCETGRSDARAIEHLAVFVSQLNALGLRAGMDVRAVPAGLHRTVRFDIAPYLLDGPIEPEDTVALVAADQLADAKLVELRRLGGSQHTRVHRLRPLRAPSEAGRGQGQAFLCVQSRSADRRSDRTGRAGLRPRRRRSGVRRQAAPAPRAGDRRRPRLLVAGAALADPAKAAALSALSLSRQIELAVLTDGQAKRTWLQRRGAGVAVYNYGEVLPFDLAANVRHPGLHGAAAGPTIACSASSPTLPRAGAALLDCTPDHAIASGSDAFVRAPSDLRRRWRPSSAPRSLPNLDELQDHVRKSSFANSLGGARIARMFGARADAEAAFRSPVAMTRRRVPVSRGEGRCSCRQTAAGWAMPSVARWSRPNSIARASTRRSPPSRAARAW